MRLYKENNNKIKKENYYIQVKENDGRVNIMAVNNEGTFLKYIAVITNKGIYLSSNAQLNENEFNDVYETDGEGKIKILGELDLEELDL